MLGAFTNLFHTLRNFQTRFLKAKSGEQSEGGVRTVGDVDKMCTSALEVIAAAGVAEVSRLLDLIALKRLAECKVDSTGQTIYMKFVVLGLESTERHYLATDLLRGSNLGSYDTNGNNLAHLAVVSHNAHIMGHLLSDLSKIEVINLLEKKNNEGRTSLELAVVTHQADMAQILKSFYAIASAETSDTEDESD